jgi:hypothetical protein
MMIMMYVIMSCDVWVRFTVAAGQEEYYVSHQFFLSESAIYLVVFNAAASTLSA